MKAELTYPISRPYPFDKWFNYATFVGASLLLILFSVFNLATNGYDIETAYTNNPNSTLDSKHWFNSWVFTWGNTKLHPQCQQLELPAGYQFMTSNQGFMYNINSIVAAPGNTTGPAQTQQLSSLLYLNNTLENCQVERIDIALTKADRSVSSGLWWSWGISHVTATASCQISNAMVPSTVSFDLALDTPGTYYSYVVVDNYTTHAPVWWGTRLLNIYFMGTLRVMAGELPDGNIQTSDFVNAAVTFTPGNNDDMQSFDLFDTSYSFLASDGSVLNIPGPGTFNNETFELSRPITEGFFFAKVLRSLILVDLGNSGPPNVLLDADLLQYVLNPPDDFNRVPGAPLNNGKVFDWWKMQGISPPGTTTNNEDVAVEMQSAYNEFINATGPLRTKSASIYAQYACSVPKGKSVPAMLFATLVADIALLQGAFALFNFLALRVAMRKDAKAMYCLGCVENGRQLGDLKSKHTGLSGR